MTLFILFKTLSKLLNSEQLKLKNWVGKYPKLSNYSLSTKTQQ